MLEIVLHSQLTELCSLFLRQIMKQISCLAAWNCLAVYLIIVQVTLLPKTGANETCTDGQYYDIISTKCLPCSSCDVFSIQLKACTNTSNTECLTCTGANRHRHPECLRCPVCRSGHYLTSPCTPELTNTCQKCRRGSYSAKPSYSTRCLRCLDCHGMNRKKLRACKGHRNAVCGKCRKGFYQISSLKNCLPCRPCSSGRQKIKACQKWGGRRSCGVFMGKPKLLNSPFYVLRYNTETLINSTTLSSTTKEKQLNLDTSTSEPDGRNRNNKITISIFLVALVFISLFGLCLIIIFVIVCYKKIKVSLSSHFDDSNKLLKPGKNNKALNLSPYNLRKSNSISSMKSPTMTDHSRLFSSCPTHSLDLDEKSAQLTVLLSHPQANSSSHLSKLVSCKGKSFL